MNAEQDTHPHAQDLAQSGRPLLKRARDGGKRHVLTYDVADEAENAVEGTDAALKSARPSMSLEELRSHLQTAIEIEHATIPTYLCALYSIKDGTNTFAAQNIQAW